MKLEILIPQYKETEKEVKPLLDSIAIQRNVDFDEIGVVIVNDGTDVHLSDDFLNSYPFKIKYVLDTHKGVSGARNTALDNATAEYVMFCDADDMFYSVCGLWLILRETTIEGGFDSLVSLFIEETRNAQTGETVFVNHEMDSTFVHGKVHRRLYLKEQGIRFCERLTIHEDSYFNILCQNLSQNVKYCPTPFYLWCWRDESVCRHDPKYMLKTYQNMIDSNDALTDEFERRGVHDKVMFYTAFMVFDAYYTMNKPEWINQENQEYRDATERRFAEYYKKHETIWQSVPLPDKMAISNGIRQRVVSEGMLMEKSTIDQWLEHIKKMGADDDNSGAA